MYCQWPLWAHIVIPPPKLSITSVLLYKLISHVMDGEIRSTPTKKKKRTCGDKLRWCSSQCLKFNIQRVTCGLRARWLGCHWLNITLYFCMSLSSPWSALSREHDQALPRLCPNHRQLRHLQEMDSSVRRNRQWSDYIHEYTYNGQFPMVKVALSPAE